MIQFIVFVFLFILTGRFLFKLVGGMLLRLALQRAMERMQKQYVDTENTFQQRYDPNFEREMMINPNLKVRVPRSEETSTQSPKRIRRPIDDVDFEEA